jgi:hypothetical protein
MTTRAHARTRRKPRSEEGAVMLIVLLVLLTGTALAATSLQATQYELRSSGYNRAALQTQYVSEAAAMTTMAWVDATAMDRSFLKYLQAWNGTTPSMSTFGEPEVSSTNRAHANRTQWVLQQSLTNFVLPPINKPGFTNGNLVDTIGTFGPRSAYVPGNEDANNSRPNYVVDLYDCRLLPNTASVGFQVNQGGSNVIRQFQYYCVVTSRGRSFLPRPVDPSSPSPLKNWTVSTATGTTTYTVNRFTMAHDARGIIVTPPIIMGN